ncbi:hypothetical protein [Lentimicrobium sp.]|uniref:hypothetical protein n=1 Tax=Lentimicrobium sp. TaxID=2034841 RepID=UPI0025DCAF4F|nr:hypothetical protein [Lentimicrobium sp.]MCO5258361.1 hypothetical protein [Lentimicrobium sp.]MCO5262978.1 hypothetical protein [Lentimicrobium sp.]HPF64470.1 hypothetical protein [Lentimicrobium sp.]HPR26582.1 hypothetical protein [Lentimicrobium sp.]HRW69766.1 hypothetical protein [Lentimicrobium sp.]
MLPTTQASIRKLPEELTNSEIRGHASCRVGHISVSDALTGSCIENRRIPEERTLYANSGHIHIQLSKSPEYAENELTEIIASSSSEFINKTNFCQGMFAWQQSCSAFSVSK